jgi:glycosyltransferase involved in cell wall biosynthesis
MTIDGQTPLVSIVIPCYNQAKYLPMSVESALAQTHPNTEIIVVNDASNDDTEDVAARYPAVRYLAQENRGVAETRNAGWHASKGEFVQFLDADDRLKPESVESHMRCFRAHPAVGFVVGDIEWIDEEGRCLGKANCPMIDSNHYEELLKKNHIANTIAVLFHRSVLSKVGGFNGFFSPAEDYEILLRAARAFPSAHHSTVVAQYRRHTTNTSRKGAVMLKATNRVFIAEREKVKGSRRLEAALREGEQKWRDFFGGVTIKEIWAEIARGHIASAATSGMALVWYVRGRIFLIPWKFRERGMAAVKRRLDRLRKSLVSHLAGIGNAAAARSSKPTNIRR